MSNCTSLSSPRISPAMRRIRTPHAISLLEINVHRSAQRHYNNGMILQFFQAEHRPFPASCLRPTNKEWLC